VNCQSALELLCGYEDAKVHRAALHAMGLKSKVGVFDDFISEMFDFEEVAICVNL
jgi:hypothetical protein